jgi:hypothetical protein
VGEAHPNSGLVVPTQRPSHVFAQPSAPPESLPDEPPVDPPVAPFPADPTDPPVGALPPTPLLASGESNGFSISIRHARAKISAASPEKKATSRPGDRCREAVRIR